MGKKKKGEKDRHLHTLSAKDIYTSPRQQDTDSIDNNQSTNEKPSWKRWQTLSSLERKALLEAKYKSNKQTTEGSFTTSSAHLRTKTLAEIEMEQADERRQGGVTIVSKTLSNEDKNRSYSMISPNPTTRGGGGVEHLATDSIRGGERAGSVVRQTRVEKKKSNKKKILTLSRPKSPRGKKTGGEDVVVDQLHTPPPSPVHDDQT